MPIVNIEGVGQVRFPDDMTQDQIAAAIHANMPQAAPPSKMGKLLNAGQSALNAAQNNPVMSALGSIGSGLKDYGQSIAYGLADPSVQLAEGTQNLVSRGLGAFTGKPAEAFGTYHDSLADQAPNQTLATIASVPGALMAPGGALMKGAKGVNALVKGAGLGAGYGAAYGAAQDPNSNILSDMGMGALLPTGMMAAGKAIPAIAGAPGNLIKRYLANKELNKVEQASRQPYSQIKTPEQAAQTLDVIGNDVPIDLGTLVNDVKLAGKYKKATNVWGSQNEQKMTQAVGKTDEIANRIAQDMSQGHDEASGTEALVNHIKENYGAHKDEFNRLDDELTQAAKNRAIDTSERPNSKAAAEQILNDLEDTTNKGGYHFLSNDTALRKLVENIKNGASPQSLDMTTMTPVNHKLNYEDLKGLRSYVGDQIGNLRNAPFNKRDPEAIGALGQIYYGLEDDMGKALEAHPDLQPLWKERSAYYKTHLKPYDTNKRVNDILHSDEQTNLFNKLNSTDSGIKKVVDDMSPSAKKLLLGLGFKGAIKEDLATGEMMGKSAMLTKGYEKLNNSPILKQVLDEKDHDLFRKLGVLHETTKDYRPLLKNPETGAKNTALLAHLAMSAPTAAIGLGGAIAGEGAMPAMLAALGTGALVKGRNVLSEIRSNPKILEAYANPAQRNSLIKEGLKSGQATKSKAQKAVSKSYERLSNPSVINYLINRAGM